MIIIRDNNGNVIRQEASTPYVATRTLRNRKEQQLSDAQLGIDREALKRENAERRLHRTNMRRVDAGLEPVFNDEGYRLIED